MMKKLASKRRQGGAIGKPLLLVLAVIVVAALWMFLDDSQHQPWVQSVPWSQLAYPGSDELSAAAAEVDAGASPGSLFLGDPVLLGDYQSFLGLFLGRKLCQCYQFKYLR